ncbi:MAG: DUF3097 domain-containing protein [Aeromicrobium sp.]|nr:MAG: DUF3097 domain-containing protein [Aeromicrobium sp.]
MADRYSGDVLSGDWRAPKRGHSVDTPAELGLVVEDATTGYVGEIMRVDRDLGTVELEDRRNKRKVFPLGPGFLLEGKPVVLKAPVTVQETGPKRTASGSIAVTGQRARVALPSRIWVEGRHDAELVEKVWGDDLRIEGVAVEYMGGADDLAAAVRDFSPSADRRLGVLLDHLVAGSKESKLAAQVANVPHVHVVGHPYIDVWQAVKPQRLGVDAWPVIDRGTEWKKGVCAAFGWPHETQTDTARAWKHILSKVNSWSDLEPEFLGRVEELIDFVTVGGH